jgi:ribosome-binding factor A
MPSHRSLRIAEAIREVVSSAILFEVSDPRVKGITVINAEVSGDLKLASVFVSIMGTKTEQEQEMKGLKSASGFLQSLVAARLQTRFTPVLSFKLDQGVKRSVEMSKLIEETLEKDRLSRESDTEAGDVEDDHDPEHETESKTETDA